MKKGIARVLTIIIAALLLISFGTPSFAYTVQKGDTLNAIARNNNVSVDDILAWNNIKNKDLIFPGQEINLQLGSTKGGTFLTAEERAILESMFDAQYYAEVNKDVVEACGNSKEALFNHFCTHGLEELRQPNKDFNVTAYSAAYRDLAAAFGTDVVLYYRHYSEFGKNENRPITTLYALDGTGVDVKVLAAMQNTTKDSNGRPQFNAFYANESKSFFLPIEEPEPEPEAEPEPEPEPAPTPEPEPEPIFFTVSFDGNATGVTGIPESQKIEKGKTASEPSASPELSGKTFGGWYTDTEGNTKFDFGTAITADITLYAKWTNSCLAAGTLIVLDNGEKKAVENVKEGELVRVFDHETGEVTTAKVFDCWKYPEKKTGAFTLHFSGNIDVKVVGGHDFFEKEANKYTIITESNAKDYIGHLFYNMDKNSWESLESVDFEAEAVDTYIFVTEKCLNCDVNGMLSCEDGFYNALINVFDFGKDLKFDSKNKAEAIDTYGLSPFSDFKFVTREDYDALNLQYLPILMGKGILTEEMIEELVAMTMEMDPDILN